jgi:hypothetical protein
MRRRSWLTHCAKSREDTCSIHYGVDGIFYFYITSGRTITFDRISLQPNWVPEIFLGGKGGWCVCLTTSPISHADCPEILHFKTPGTLWVCNRTVLVIGMLYRTLYSAALFLQTNGFQIWSCGPRECHTNFLRGRNNFWVSHRNFTVGMKYFKFKTELKFPLSPYNTRTTVNKFQFTAVPTSSLLDSGSIWLT